VVQRHPSVSPEQFSPMRLNQIRVFLAVVDAGSVHAAARVLGISQPSVTKTLRTLEDDLRVRLLERTRRGVIPTDAGIAFVARARNVQSELRRATEELEQISGERAGTVSFGVSHVAMPILGPAMKRFQLRCPHAQVRTLVIALAPTPGGRRGG
jgi:DNA-binding transcriptional LysR family regulator